MIKETTILGVRVRRRLRELKKTQAWLAEQVGLSNEAISRWCKGTSDPALSNLKTASVALRCKVSYLVGEDADESIAEVVRIMENLCEEQLRQVLSGVIAVAASMPVVLLKKTAA